VRLHLLDGTYELFRAYFGFPKRQAPDGREVGATLGIIETTLSLLRDPGVTHLAVATDTVIESFRNDLFPGYKSSLGVDPELLAQFPLAEEAFEALGLVCWRMREYEADDAIATAAWRWCEEVEQVVICTPDKDLAQCVLGDRIVTYNRREQTVLNEDGVVAKFGIAPESIPDYLALVGDTADGVPGLPGWGAKSASTVLARYRKLEAIPNGGWDVSVRGAAKLAATLQERFSEALLYRELTTLRLDVQLPQSLADMEWRGVDRERFEALCDGQGFEDVKGKPHRFVNEARS
jgi:5'-3' exonuclease